MHKFGHETRNIYQESLRFIERVTELLETIAKNLSVHKMYDEKD